MFTTFRMRVVFFGLGAALVAWLIALFGLNGADVGASAAVKVVSDSSYAPSCDGQWELVASPNVDGQGYVLNISVVSDDDIWAVGEPTVMHWDGSEWSETPIPNAGEMYVTSVEAISSNDVWAVGYMWSGSGPVETLMMHWNGSVWNVVPSPNTGIYSNNLYGVHAQTSDDVWAVGSYNNDYMSGPERTLVLHWDGTVWSIIPSANLNEPRNVLESIGGISNNDLWAVGYYKEVYNNLQQGPELSLIMHWDGIGWSVVDTPNIGGLKDIFRVSSTDFWTVGSSPLHWNGGAWEVVPGAVLTGTTTLRGIDGATANDIWAVGYRMNGTIGPYDSIIEHWDGSSWTQVQSVEPGDGSTLADVAVVSGRDVWAGGTYWPGGGAFSKTLVEHFDAKPCPPTPTPEPPRCPGERFTDNCPGDYFYQHVLDLNNLGVVSGYTTSPPCTTVDHVPCFKPYNSATRGQIAKVVSLAAGFNQPVTTLTFEDVPVGHNFYLYIERLATLNIINGYPCGGPGEPCGSPVRPYFRPGNTVTRGQLAKIAALAFGFLGSASTQTFEDIPPGYTFYDQIEKLAVNNIIGGYTCGNPEPCVPPGNRPYYRAGNDISRGQIAKIINLARMFVIATITPTPAETRTPTTATPEPTLAITYTPTEIAGTLATATTTPTETTTPDTPSK